MASVARLEATEAEEESSSCADSLEGTLGGRATEDDTVPGLETRGRNAKISHSLGDYTAN